jgi:DNA-binding transcriptional regulator YiaG
MASQTTPPPQEREVIREMLGHAAIKVKEVMSDGKRSYEARLVGFKRLPDDNEIDLSTLTVEELQEREIIIYRQMLARYITLDRRHTRRMAQEAKNPVDKRCKLTPRQVNEMRQAYVDKVSMRQLAKRYSVSVSTVSNIVNGLYWKSLKTLAV